MSTAPSAQFRLNIRVKIDDAHGTLGALTAAIGEVGGLVGAVDLVEVDGSQSLRDIVVDASGKDHWERIIAAIEGLDGVEVIDTTDRTFLLHVGRQDRTAQQAPAEDQGGPLDGLHAGRGARFAVDRRRPRQGIPVHDQAQHGGGRLRRVRDPRTGRRSAPRPRCR